MRILVVSYFFPPCNTVSALRVGKTAKFLRAHGHDVKVLTAKDPPFPPGQPVEIPEADVVRTRWLDVDRLRRTLRSRGAAAGPAAATAPAFAPGAAAPGARPLLSRLKSAASRAYWETVLFPDEAVGWTPFALAAGARLLRRWRPDVVFASAGPYTSLVVADALARMAGVPWIAELRDLWTDGHRYWFRGLRRRADLALERRLLTSAAGLVTVSEPLAATLRERFGRPVAAVTNGFDPDDFAGDVASSDPGQLDVVHCGSIVPGVRDPSALFDAIARMGTPRRVRVRFFGAWGLGVAELAARFGVGDAVEVHGVVPYAQALALERRADALLFLVWDTPGRCGLYSGKLLEYLGAGRPILALGPRNDVGQLILDRRAGVLLEDADAIAAQLERWLAEKAAHGRVAGPPASAGDGFTREDQVRILERFLAERIEKQARS